MKFIDVHCHINDRDYGDIAPLMAQIQANGVQKIICAGFDLESSLFAQRLADEWEGVYFTAGFHPTELKKYQEGDLAKIEALCAHPKCVAIGEIGLDYHYEDTDKPLQHRLFIEQLALARKLGMPVQIHSRDACEDTLAVLNDYAQGVAFTLHCYAYSPEVALRLSGMGATFSFGGTSTYKRSKKARRSIEQLPVDRLMTETDSPYLPPSSAFGSFPNTPCAIPEICANMATLKGVTDEEMARIVWQNAHEFFPKLN